MRAAVPAVLVLALVAGVAARQLRLVTVATRHTDGWRRLLRSADIAGVAVTTLGAGQAWRGPGWGVQLLRAEMQRRTEEEEEGDLVLVTHSQDVILAASKEDIIAQYESFDADIVFGAERRCRPDPGLADQHPEAGEGELRFLNSGAFIGPAQLVAGVLEEGGDIGDQDDDQLFYTRLYINPELRTKYKMRLDHRAQLFQNLQGEEDSVELRFSAGEPHLHHLVHGTRPVVVHGGGPSKPLLNTLGNYLARSHHLEAGCLACGENRLEVSSLLEIPRVVLAIFIEKPTPFMTEFWEKISALMYYKPAMDLYIHNAVSHHQEEVAAFVEESRGEYHSVTVRGQDLGEAGAREAALQLCRDTRCDYMFVVDSTAHLDNQYTLMLLLEQVAASHII